MGEMKQQQTCLNIIFICLLRFNNGIGTTLSIICTSNSKNYVSYLQTAKNFIIPVSF